MNIETITREVRHYETSALDAELRALRLTKTADSIAPGISLGHLDELLRGLIVERMSYADGQWCTSVRIDLFGEVPRSGFGATLSEALADSLRWLAKMQAERAAEKRALAKRWLESSREVA